MKWIVWVGSTLTTLALVGACSSSEDDEPSSDQQDIDPATEPDKEDDPDEGVPICERLFGLPNEKTGLTVEQCSPECADCDDEGAFSAGEILPGDLATLRSLTLSNPLELLAGSPYESPGDFPEQPSKICALTREGETGYRLDTFADKEAALDAGAQITHEGACGACSSLRDLAVYMEVPDLTTPVKQCGVTHLAGDVDDLAGCISALGFSEQCSQIWAYNSLNTRQECLQECLAALNASYHQEDGSPNACIQCDEEKSGPVFKAVAGRTRRNSGLPTALCRPCAGVAHIEHRYLAD